MRHYFTRFFSFFVAISMFVACDCQRDTTEDFSNRIDSVFSSEGYLQEIIVYEGDQYRFTKKQFYPDGKLLFEGKYGTHTECPVALDEHYYYRADGSIEKRLTHRHFFQKDQKENCDNLVSVQEELVFFADGQTPQKTKLYRNCINCKRSACGEWIDFDEDGNRRSAVIYDNDCMEGLVSKD